MEFTPFKVHPTTAVFPSPTLTLPSTTSLPKIDGNLVWGPLLLQAEASTIPKNSFSKLG